MVRGTFSGQFHEALDNNVMHAKPDLRVFLKWMIADSGSVITDVMWAVVRDMLAQNRSNELSR